MKDYKTCSLIELQKIGNDLKINHEKKKKEITEKTYQIDELEKEINKNLKELEIIEEDYVNLIEELNNR